MSTDKLWQDIKEITRRCSKDRYGMSWIVMRLVRSRGG